MNKKLLAAIIIIALGATLFIIKRNAVKHEEGVLALSGNVEVTEVNVGFKSSGRIAELSADEGQKVKKGDRLAMLDNTEQQNILTQNSAFLNEAVARLDDLKAGHRSQEIEQARASLNAAEAELVRARKDRERAERLYKEEVMPASQYDAVKSTYETLAARQRNAEEALSLIKEGPRKKEIMAAEQRVEQARAALKISDTRFKDSVIYAPLSGVILKKNVEPGEIVAQGLPVLTIGDLENPWVKVYVKEDKLGLVKLGQQAKIAVDSYPGKIYDGTVSYISSEAEFTPKNVQTQEERVKLVFGVKVRVKNMNDELKPGMPADVRILLK